MGALFCLCFLTVNSLFSANIYCSAERYDIDNLSVTGNDSYVIFANTMPDACSSAIGIERLLVAGRHSKDTLSITGKDSLPAAIRDSSFAADMRLVFKMIERNPNDTIVNMLTRMINGSKSPLNRDIAMEAYNYFINPSYMGQEVVGIRVANEFLLKEFADSIPLEDRFAIEGYVKMIEPTLVGKQAPELKLYDIKNNQIDVNKIFGVKILYFYSLDCATCKIETPELIKLLKGYDGLIDINLIAILTDPPAENNPDYTEKWKRYIDENFSFNSEHVTIYNLNDHNFSSDFPLKYALISTPQIYLISRSNTILGRGLKTNSLSQLLDIANGENKLLFKIFDTAFSEYAKGGSVNYRRGIEAVNSLVNRFLKSEAGSKINKDEISDYLMPKLIDYLYCFDKLEGNSFNMKYSVRKRIARFINKKYLPFIISLN